MFDLKLIPYLFKLLYLIEKTIGIAKLLNTKCVLALIQVFSNSSMYYTMLHHLIFFV